MKSFTTVKPTGTFFALPDYPVLELDVTEDGNALTVGDDYDHLPSYDLPLEVRVRVVLAGVVAPVLRDRGVWRTDCLPSCKAAWIQHFVWLVPSNWSPWTSRGMRSGAGTCCMSCAT